jgi:hypothetical protein
MTIAKKSAYGPQKFHGATSSFCDLRLPGKYSPFKMCG